jgi:hypothetical protein
VGDLDFSRTYFRAPGPGDPGRPGRASGNTCAEPADLGLARARARGPAEAKGAAASLGGAPTSRRSAPERRPHPLPAGPAPAEPAHAPPHPRRPAQRGARRRGSSRPPRDAPHQGHPQAQRRRGGPADRGGRRLVQLVLGRQHARALAAEVLPPDADRDPRPHRRRRPGAGLQGGDARVERDAQLAGSEENDDVVSFARRILRKKFFGAPVRGSGRRATRRASRPPAGRPAALWKRLLVGPGVVCLRGRRLRSRQAPPRSSRPSWPRIPKGKAVGAGPLFEGRPSRETSSRSSRASRRSSSRASRAPSSTPRTSTRARCWTSSSAAWPRGSSSG